MQRKRAGAIAAAVVAATTAGGVALAAGPPGASGGGSGLNTADLTNPTRANVAPSGVARQVSRSVQRARADLRDSLGSRAVLSIDERTGGVKAVGRTNGFLTGASQAGAKEIALGWVRAHSGALGLGAADIDALKLVRDYTSIDGVRHLQWAQVVDGITVADTSLIANVTDSGRLINVLGGARGGLSLNSARPAITASGAYASTLRSVGSSARVPARRSARTTGSRLTTYKGSGRAQLVAVTAGDGLRLAWRVLAPVGRVGDYDSLVDASTGRLLRRANLVKFATALAADNFPGAPDGGTQQARDITPWLFPGADTLSGNNAHAFLDVNDVVKAELTEDQFLDTFTVPPSGEVHPSSASDWLYPIQSVADATGNCPALPPGCTWNHSVANSWQTNQNEATTQLFYFVNKFHDHLLAPPIGFDEASGNFQQNNPSGQGTGGDPVLAQADDGANTGTGTRTGLPDGGHIDNANMDPRPEGIPARMQMYLFQPPGFGAVNGSDDPSIVYHEYTHGLSNRLIVDSQGFGAVGGVQSGAMGEAWSDWYALDLLAREGLLHDTAAVGDVKEGSYVDNGTNQIRSEPIDCPPDENPGACPGTVAAEPGGYTYADFGRVVFGDATGTRISEVHADGEIWVQTLWQLRQRLVDKYGEVDGSKRAEALVTGGMRLGPPSPSYLDQRNGILQEDTVLGGQDTALIWEVFAARGMGYFAATRGDYDRTPDADFSLPPAAGGPTGTLRGTVTNDSSQPVAGARVGLTGHDGPPAAGPALQAVTAANGTYTLTGIPQANYPNVSVDAPAGFADDDAGGAVAIGGAPVTKDFVVRRNFADSAGGATITSDARNDAPWGCGWGNLIDGNQATVLETAPPDGDDPVRTFTITLPRAVNGAEVWIDPSAGCGTIEFSGLGFYDVEVSTDGTTFQHAGGGVFEGRDNGHLNRVAMKDVPDGVKAVRLIAETTQGDDPVAPLGDQGVLDIAELEVYGRPGGTPPVTPAPTTTPTPTPTPPAAKLRPVINSTRHKLTVNRRTRRVSVKLRCAKATAGTTPKRCRGVLFLAGGKKGRANLATRTFSIPAAKTVTVRLHLTAKAVRILKRHPVETRLRARVLNPGAGMRTARYPVRVTLAKRP
jgi:extracellular elastinolytic metalloproteinase